MFVWHSLATVCRFIHEHTDPPSYKRNCFVVRAIWIFPYVGTLTAKVKWTFFMNTTCTCLSLRLGKVFIMYNNNCFDLISLFFLYKLWWYSFAKFPFSKLANYFYVWIIFLLSILKYAANVISLQMINALSRLNFERSFDHLFFSPQFDCLQNDNSSK